MHDHVCEQHRLEQRHYRRRAALGAVALTGRLGNKSKRLDQRRADCAAVVQAAGALLDNHRQVMRMEEDAVDSSVAFDYNRRADGLSTELRRAVAIVEITGSSGARTAARKILEAGAGQVSSHLVVDDAQSRSTWMWITKGPGDIAFERGVEAFIDAVRSELVPRRFRLFLPTPPP